MPIPTAPALVARCNGRLLPSWSRAAAALCLVLGATACTGTLGLEDDDGVYVGSSAITLAAGDSVSVDSRVSVGGRLLTDLGVSWESSDPMVASVRIDGLLRALSPGFAILRVRYRRDSDTTTVRVLAPGEWVGADFVQLVAGASFACGIDASTSLYCWGDNWHRQIGRSSARYTRVVSPVPTGGRQFSDVSPGSHHVCALDIAGAPWCWGDSRWGQWGTGASGIQLMAGEPRSVSTSHTFVSIASGGRHTCALTQQGQVYCWGDSFGALPTLIESAASFDVLAAGGLHTCAIDALGDLYCWGDNSFGQLGDGSTVSTPQPIQVDLPGPATSVSAGSLHTCALSEAVVHCWGNNWNGRLGNGSEIHSTVPVVVDLGSPAARVAAGGAHTCALTTGGAAHCWGQNDRGQLGVDFPYGVQLGPYVSSVPVTVSAAISFSEISAGSEHTCALAGTAAYCWGANTMGQLGLGAVRPYPGLEVQVAIVPTRVVAPML